MLSVIVDEKFSQLFPALTTPPDIKTYVKSSRLKSSGTCELPGLTKEGLNGSETCWASPGPPSRSAGGRAVHALTCRLREKWRKKPESTSSRIHVSDVLLFPFFFSFHNCKETVDLLPTLGTQGVRVTHGDLFTKLLFHSHLSTAKPSPFMLMETLMVYLIP